MLYFSIQPYSRDYSHRMNGSESSISSEDSNDENNYRNDYPSTEEEDNESINEDDMRKAFKTMNIGNRKCLTIILLFLD